MAVLVLAAFFAGPRFLGGTPAPSAPAAVPISEPVLSAELTNIPLVGTTPDAPATAERDPYQAAAGSEMPRLSSNTSALVTIVARIPLDISENNHRLGTTGEGQLALAPGPHRLELTNRRFNYRSELTLSLEPGQILSHTMLLPSGQLRIRGVAGTEVWVEGERIGTMPLGDVSVPIGTREVVFRHPQLGERRQAVEVLVGTPADVAIPFGTPTAAEAANILRESAAASPVPPGSAQPPKLAPLSAARPPRSDAIR
jgi:hypothetical protein